MEYTIYIDEHGPRLTKGRAKVVVRVLGSGKAWEMTLTPLPADEISASGTPGDEPGPGDEEHGGDQKDVASPWPIFDAMMEARKSQKPSPRRASGGSVTDDPR